VRSLHGRALITASAGGTVGPLRKNIYGGTNVDRKKRCFVPDLAVDDDGLATLIDAHLVDVKRRRHPL